MAKPDKAGIWKSREGLWARAWYRRGQGLLAEIIDQAGHTRLAHYLNEDHECGYWPARDLPGDDWLQAIEPEFPELPDPPLRCLVQVRPISPIEWAIQFTGNLFDIPKLFPLKQYHASELAVVPHSQNDPEAVHLIEASYGE